MLWGSVTIGQDALGYGGADWSGCPGVRCRLVRMLWGTVPIGQDALGLRLVDALGYADWSGCSGVRCRLVRMRLVRMSGGVGCSECRLVRMLWGTVPIGQDALGYWGQDVLVVPIGQDALGYGADWSGCSGVRC